jgi:hypothetical protein
MAFVTTTVHKAAIRAWLVSEWESDVPVIFDKQGRRPPASPYCTVNLDGPRTLGGEHRGAITDNGIDLADPNTADQAVALHQRIDASINIYGPDAMDRARGAVEALGKTQVKDNLRSAGLAPPHERPDPRNLSALVKTAFEERAQFDVSFGFGAVFTDSFPLIETFEGEVTLYKPDGTVRSVSSFEAP